MSYITSEEYIAAIGGYRFLEKVARKLAEDYMNEFIGGKHATIEDIDIEGDEITGSIKISYDVTYCGCCYEYESCDLPIDYLWDDDWQSRERDKREERIRIREERKAKKEAEYKVEREKKRYTNYLKMKEEYEPLEVTRLTLGDE